MSRNAFIFSVVLAAFLINGCAAKKAERTPVSTPAPMEMPADDFETSIPGIGTFLILLDVSGSNYLPYKGETKLKLLKNIVRRMNNFIPHHLLGGLRTMGPDAGAFSKKTSLIYGMTGHTPSALDKALDTIRWSGGKTPLDLILYEAGKDLQVSEGKIALIIISDGKTTPSSKPIVAAEKLKGRYGERLCLYTVLIGDLENGKALLEEISRNDAGRFWETADNLRSDNGMENFVNKVFSCEPLGPSEIRMRASQPVFSVEDQIIQFELNKWKILPEYEAVLDRIADHLTRHPDAKLKVQGHTCNIWTEKYNKKLSHWRAMAVTSALVKRGVSSERLVVEGFGLTLPKYPNDTPHHQSLNRRVEFRFAN